MIRCGNCGMDVRSCLCGRDPEPSLFADWLKAFAFFAVCMTVLALVLL